MKGNKKLKEREREREPGPPGELPCSNSFAPSVRRYGCSRCFYRCLPPFQKVQSFRGKARWPPSLLLHYLPAGRRRAAPQLLPYGTSVPLCLLFLSWEGGRGGGVAIIPVSDTIG